MMFLTFASKKVHNDSSTVTNLVQQLLGSHFNDKSQENKVFD